MDFRFKWLGIISVLLSGCSQNFSERDELGNMYYRNKNDFSIMDAYVPGKLYSDYLNFQDIEFVFSHTETMVFGTIYVFHSTNFQQDDTLRVNFNDDLPRRFNGLYYSAWWECKLNKLPGKKIILNSENKNAFKCRRENDVLDMFMSFSAIMDVNGFNVPYSLAFRLQIPKL